MLENISKQIRRDILEMTTRVGSGHPTSSLSAVELMSVLFFGKEEFFRYDVTNPENSTNDRLIFSKGHASPLFYALWAAAGGIEHEELLTYRVFGSRLEGHPTRKFPFTEVPTGSLGQGLGVGVGVALGLKNLMSSDARTFVLLGDSEMAEGSVWEAAEIASHYHLGNLVAIIDMNRLGQRGETLLGHNSSFYRERMKVFGWKVFEVDGHDTGAIADTYRSALKQFDVPVCIVAKTIKGKGVSFLEDADGWHGKPLSEEQLAQSLAEVEEDYDSSNITITPLSCPCSRGTIGGSVEMSDTSLSPAITVPKFSVPKIGELAAVRKMYGNVLVELGSVDDRVVVLDAEVSNSTFSAPFAEVFPKRFFEMFIAEQNMVSVGAGLARRGFIPFVSTFGAFFTRAFDQIRMATYSGINMVLVGSHVGISIGEDGVSQMALEDMAMFRSLFESVVLYPCDAVSMRALLHAAHEASGITYIRSTRAETPVLYNENEMFEIGGSKTLAQSGSDEITIITAGITVNEALLAAKELSKMGVNTRVIDAYSIKPIDTKTLQEAATQTKLILTVEDHYPAGGLGCAVRDALTANETPVYSLAVSKMPMSGKPEELLRYAGIDAVSIVNKVQSLL